MRYSKIPNDLIDAYRAADYHVEAGPAPFRFRIQQYSPHLVELLALARLRSACFVTAYNPFSQPHDETSNRAAHERLRGRLASLTAHLYDAAGIDTSGGWPAEPGYLAVGVSLTEAKAVGREFRQNAIVWVGADALPELTLLR